MAVIRPHKKSRDGCEGCKRRKIKCDEIQPICTFCSSRRVPCTYPVRVPKASKSVATSSPQSSHSSSSSSSSSYDRKALTSSPGLRTQFSPDFGLKTMQELRLMHNYSAVLSPMLSLTSFAKKKTTKVWQLEIPRIAFGKDFLMHTVLCFSSHHIQLEMEKNGSDTTLQARQTDFYLDNALRGYRQAIFNLNPNNIEAVLAASMIFLILTTRHYVMHVHGELWIVSLLGLHSGMQSLEAIMGEKLSQSPLYPLLGIGRKLPSELPVVPPILEEMLASPESSNLALEHMKSLWDVLKTIGALYRLLGSANTPAAQGMLSLKIMAVGKEFPPEFGVFVKQRQPQALVILVYYLSFMKLLTRRGFLADNLKSDAHVVIKCLGAKWKRYIETPIRIFLPENPINDPKEIMRELMLQLPLETDPAATPFMPHRRGFATNGTLLVTIGNVEEIADVSIVSEKYGLQSYGRGTTGLDVPTHTGRGSISSSVRIPTRPLAQSARIHSRG